MSTETYMNNRKKYHRPQGMLFSENSGTLIDGFYVPQGLEVGQDPGSVTDTSLYNQFLILSDDNRSSINIKPTRIEKRERMINGRMRSYHIADKLTISVSYDLLPSRSFFTFPEFNSEGISPHGNDNSLQFTTDGGAGGVDILEWYENHKGSFWLFLSYDNYKNFKNSTQISNRYAHLDQYSQLVEVFFQDFNYDIIKRGQNFDFWNISFTLEEV